MEVGKRMEQLGEVWDIMGHYRKFVGYLWDICGILWDICGILWDICVFQEVETGNPFGSSKSLKHLEETSV